jgi:hypothetical protein
VVNISAMADTSPPFGADVGQALISQRLSGPRSNGAPPRVGWEIEARVASGA